jgi:Xaa-Pro aminopeptidase
MGLGLSCVRTYGQPLIDLLAVPTALLASDQKLLGILRTSAGDTPTEALLALLRDLGLAEAMIGLEMEGLQPCTRDQIRRALPKAELRDCSNLVRLIRMVKSSGEIVLLERSAEISEQAAMESLQLAQPGRPISELAQRYRVSVAQMGGALDHYSYGIRGVGIVTQAEYHLREGDFLAVDFGSIYQRYFPDAAVTAALGAVGPEVLRNYHALVDCQARAIELIRPGVKSSVVASVMQASLTDAGIATSFPHGHGLGLEIRDYQVVVGDNGLRIYDDCIDLPLDLPLEEDMVLSLEASSFLFGSGSLQCEQSLVVTHDGCRPLVKQPRSEPVIVW